MNAVSYALGRWRGRNGKPRAVALAPTVCTESYSDGFDHGAAERAAAPRRYASAARGPRVPFNGRMPNRPGGQFDRRAA